VAETSGAKHISALELLERINSSCSSGRERRKSVSGSAGRLIAAAEHGNLEMVKYCVANECPIDTWACACAALKRSSRVPQILTRRSQSALGFGNCQKWSSSHTRISC